jgi:plasmid stability protein
MISLHYLGAVMASLTIRNIEDSLKAKLRLRAAQHGRSMEEEARQLLRQALVRHRSPTGLGSRISGRFRELGGVDLADAKRSLPRQPPAFAARDDE